MNRVLFLLLLVVFGMRTCAEKKAIAQNSSQILTNGGFEKGASDGNGGGAQGWQPYELGYRFDTNTVHHGLQSLRCDSANAQSKRGASTILTLNQQKPTPLIISAWSKSDAVSGTKNPDYAIYVDVIYADGEPLWGLSAPFRAGTHDWERRSVRILPTKPIKSINIYALFRNHSGTVWFDDFAVQTLEGNRIFDGQPILNDQKSKEFFNSSPSQFSLQTKEGLTLKISQNGQITLPNINKNTPNIAGGFWIRDVANDSELQKLSGAPKTTPDGGVRISATSNLLNITFTAKLIVQNDSVFIDGEITNKRKWREP